MASRSARSRSCAGFISAQWNGALTGSSTARRAPAAFASSTGPLDRARVPGDHHLVRRIEIGGADHLALRGLLQNPVQLALGQFENAPPWRPRPPARPPAYSGRACAPAAPRRRKAGCPRPPAPSTRPGCGRRRSPASAPPRSTSNAAIETVSNAGCVFSVSLSWSSGPSKHSRESAKPSASSASSKTRRAAGYFSASALPIPAN